jgi:hypothetical protein
MNHYNEKKTKKKLKKTKVFHYEPFFTIVFHDYIKKVRFLEKMVLHSYLFSKITLL